MAYGKTAVSVDSGRSQGPKKTAVGVKTVVSVGSGRGLCQKPWFLWILGVAYATIHSFQPQKLQFLVAMPRIHKSAVSECGHQKLQFLWILGMVYGKTTVSVDSGHGLCLPQFTETMVYAKTVVSVEPRPKTAVFAETHSYCEFFLTFVSFLQLETPKTSFQHQKLQFSQSGRSLVKNCSFRGLKTVVFIKSYGF